MVDRILYEIGKILALILPVEVSYAIGAFIGRLKFYIALKDRRTVFNNMRIVTSNEDKRLIWKLSRRVFENFGRSVVDFLSFSKINKDFIETHVDVYNKEYLDYALSENTGVIIISAHLGNWELGGAVVSSLGYRLNGVALPHLHPDVNAFFNKQRAMCGEKIIPIGVALRRIFRLLKNKEIVAFVADRDFGKDGTAVDFSGKEAVVPRGAARFCIKARVPIIPVFIVRKSKDYFSLSFEKPISFKDINGVSKKEADIIQEYFSVIEKYVKKYPDQWYMFQDLFRG